MLTWNILNNQKPAKKLTMKFGDMLDKFRWILLLITICWTNDLMLGFCQKLCEYVNFILDRFLFWEKRNANFDREFRSKDWMRHLLNKPPLQDTVLDTVLIRSCLSSLKKITTLIFQFIHLKNINKKSQHFYFFFLHWHVNVNVKNGEKSEKACYRREPYKLYLTWFHFPYQALK